MRTTHPTQTSAAFNILDLLIVLVTVALVFIFLLYLPMISQPKTKAKRINCISNLKQVGLAFRMWANEHNEKFPMSVSTNQGGSMEYNETGQVFRHFLAVSNELNSPKVLVCSSDTKRTKTASWALDNHNVSYFVRVDSIEINPQIILSGDRNVTGGILTNGNVMVFNASSPAGWQQSIHMGCGNILLGDGSAQQVADSGLRRQIAADTNAIVRFAIP